MRYYEVWVADGQYHGGKPLTYCAGETLTKFQLVSVPLRGRVVNGFIARQVSKPKIAIRPIKAAQPAVLPAHLLSLADWISQYYAATSGDALRLLTPGGSVAHRAAETSALVVDATKLRLDTKLTADQAGAIKKIKTTDSSTILLHGETGSGKTRVYLELAADVIKKGLSVIILTPEIALTTQLSKAAKQFLDAHVYVLHSQLPAAERKKIWLKIVNSIEPVVVVGARSALFAPVARPGLIVVDEAHEPSYKSDQSPRYHTSRVASKLAQLSGAKVVLGSATPLISDFHLAKEYGAVVTMKQLAVSSTATKTEVEVIDMRDRSNFSTQQLVSRQLLAAIRQTLKRKQQVLIYLNRRGSARVILCHDCGWRLVCPRCDVSMIYHADKHEVVCHSCGFRTIPPQKCPDCGSSDVVYKTPGTKALAENLAKLFPQARLQRFDSDNLAGEGVHDLYDQLQSGQIDIMVGTQLLAKGLDLPKLGLVGIVAADSSLTIPDFSASERTFQLIYQVIGRVGRGHSSGQVVIQTYSPDSLIIQAAISRNWTSFYKSTLAERQKFGFPPYQYLLKLVVQRNSLAGVQKAAKALHAQLAAQNLPVKLIGPIPSFYGRRRNIFYWQLVVKSARREHLLALAAVASNKASIDIDPSDLL